MHVKQSVLKRYIKNRAESVGKLKAGWLAPLMKFGGGKKPAAWITKHAEKGFVNDQMKPNGNGYIEFWNTVKYASNWLDVNAFVMKSQKRMVQTKIRHAIKAAARKAQAA